MLCPAGAPFVLGCALMLAALAVAASIPSDAGGSAGTMKQLSWRRLNTFKSRPEGLAGEPEGPGAEGDAHGEGAPGGSLHRGLLGGRLVGEDYAGHGEGKTQGELETKALLADKRSSLL